MKATSKVITRMLLFALLAAAFSTTVLLSSSDYNTMSLGSKIVWFVMVTPVVMLGGIGMYLMLFRTDAVMKIIDSKKK